MELGYPDETVMNSVLEASGIEMPALGDMNYYLEEKQQLWRILMLLGCIRPLSVYATSATTFNVVGGRYDYNGTIKTYVPGEAVNPTDNDITYIWLNNDNSIGSGIDGDGWPVTEHIKLAEIDVDTDGVITDIRDMRTVQFTITPAA